MTADSFKAGEILDFWFGELGEKDWFSGGTELDDKIRARFLGVCKSVRGSPTTTYLENADTALAAILVLDQFTRNIFRGTAEAFSGDQSALAITHAAIDRKFDQGMEKARIPFLYMPLMHSEVMADQEMSVKLFGDLGMEENLKYAIEHRDIVARFGRFPHRNRALNRQNTPEEAEFLKQHKGYGQ